MQSKTLNTPVIFTNSPRIYVLFISRNLCYRSVPLVSIRVRSFTQHFFSEGQSSQLLQVLYLMNTYSFSTDDPINPSIGAFCVYSEYTDWSTRELNLGHACMYFRRFPYSRMFTCMPNNGLNIKFRASIGYFRISPYVPIGQTWFVI